jgi:hypothetical protein
MTNKTSQHILNTSANLLGFCLIVITSLHIADMVQTHFIDEFTSLVALFFTVSSILSFSSIRSKKESRQKRFESIADYFFIAGLVGILVIILLITLNLLK